MNEERQLKAMRILEDHPEMTQRELTRELRISLGAVNFCLRALVKKGWVKIERFQKSQNKRGYLYLLTPTGIVEKSKISASFLARKLNEYEVLKAEIESLDAEVKQSRRPTPPT